MRTPHSTDIGFRVAIMATALLVAGCSSSVKKVMPKSNHDMASVYAQYSGANSEKDLELRKRELQLRDQESLELRSEAASSTTGFPPQPEQLQHLFPKLSNPELYMFVRPHAVGTTGAPIPAYMTRFPMYERDHYALPGETVDTIRRNEMVSRAKMEEERQEQLRHEDEVRRKKQRANSHRPIRGGINR
jgi:conjugative transfer region lipoprotein (TIGR03751 family)